MVLYCGVFSTVPIVSPLPSLFLAFLTSAVTWCCSRLARMWAGGMGVKLLFKESGGHRGVYTQQSNGWAWGDEFGMATNRIMGRMVGCIWN